MTDPALRDLAPREVAAGRAFASRRAIRLTKAGSLDEVAELSSAADRYEIERFAAGVTVG
jgi:hypothetical protein